jgi:hypothetical protein
VLTVEQAEEVQKSSAGKLIAETTARTRVNRFILENLRDCFSAGQPRIVIVGQEPAWSVPIVFAYPDRVLGVVGEVLLEAVSGEVLGFTPPTEIYRNARQFLS